MSIFRVNKEKDYVVMSKSHFKEKKMSLKAKGLLSEMLSLPDEWDYSINGLVAINKENEKAIESALLELKEFGYLKITKLYPGETTSGRIEYIYDVYENSIKKQEGDFLGVEILGVEKQGVEIQGVENQAQYNNKQLNNNILNNNNIKKGKKFIKPTIEEINNYCKERNNGINAEAFYDFYESKDWYVGKNKMKDWKACMRTWEKRNKNNNIRPSWFDKEIEKEEEYIISDEDRERFGIKKTD